MKKFYQTGPFRLIVAFLFLSLSLAAFSGCGGEVSGNITPVSGPAPIPYPVPDPVPVPDPAPVPDPVPDVGSVTLSWQAPTTNEDNTPLMDLAGYRVYYGETSGVYTGNVTVGNYTGASIGNLPVGKTLYFAVAAFDTSGNESIPSNEVSIIL